jgi:hypothetical protein
MKFKLKFAYEVRYRHHRHWYTETALVQSSTIVDILEVATPSRPAFEVGQVMDRQSGTGAWQCFRLIDGRPGRVWRLDGLCFAEYCSIQVFEDRALQRDDNPFASAHEGESAQLFPSFGTVTSYEELSTEKKVKEWYDDNGRAKAARIGRRAAAMRVIDGMVCVQVSEPVVAVAIEPLSVTVQLCELLSGHHRALWGMREYTPFSRRYRLENFHEAERYARRTAREKDLELQSGIVVHHAESRSPLLCQEGEHLYQTSKQVEWKIGHSSFPLRDGEVASGLLKILAETPEDHATEALADAAEAMLNELKQIPNDDLPFNESLELFETRRALEEDVRSWRQRTYHLDDFAARALPLPASEPSIAQLLSRAALHETASTLNIPSELLEQEHDFGNLLVRYFDEVQVIAVVTPTLSLKCFYGKYGRIVAVDGEAFNQFLAENLARRSMGNDDDAFAFASLSFD